MSKAILTGKGRRWVERGHPWVYSDDIAAAEGTPGELVPVSDPNENPLGWALFSNSSRIAFSASGARQRRLQTTPVALTVGEE